MTAGPGGGSAINQLTDSLGTGGSGMPPTPTKSPRKQLLSFEQAKADHLATSEAEDRGNTSASKVAPFDVPAIDQATAAAVAETRNKFFAVRDAGAANRKEQGQLLLRVQDQLAKYGAGTFTAMLLAARPEGFGFKSTTSAYDLIDEAQGRPKRSHKAKPSTGISTPGRSNETARLPLNLDGAPLPTVQAEVPDDLPATLDTSHTHTYVSLPFKGIYVPKEHLEGFTVWLKSFSPAALSCQFVTWYQAASPASQEENNAASPIIQ